MTQSQNPNWLPSSFKSTFEIILESLSFLSMKLALIRAFIISHPGDTHSLIWTHFLSLSLLQTTAPLTLLFPSFKMMTSYLSSVSNLPAIPHTYFIYLQLPLLPTHAYPYCPPSLTDLPQEPLEHALPFAIFMP